MSGAAVASGAADTGAAAPPEPTAPAALTVLRVLSGVHLGAEVPIRAERLLIGNLDTECDLVLDVGRPERHACLLRISADGWTVLTIAGDAWIGTDYLEAQQTRSFGAGEPITLGRIAFAVGDAAATPWSKVRPPVELVRATPDGPVPVAAALGTPPRVLQGWRATRLAAGLGIGALAIAAGLSYAVSVVQTQLPHELETARRVEAARALLQADPLAAEVAVLPDQDQPGALRLRGYVREVAHAAAVQNSLSRLDAPVVARLHAVATLEADLLRRLAPVDGLALRYLKDGGFELQAAASQLRALEPLLRTALQEAPALRSVRIVLTDLWVDDGSSAAVTLQRAAERPSDIKIEGAELLAATRRHHRVKEVRIGALPSMQLADGGRYFVGGMLPDGWLVESIAAETVTLRYGRTTRTLAVAAPLHLP
jgi:hypothetical protein